MNLKIFTKRSEEYGFYFLNPKYLINICYPIMIFVGDEKLLNQIGMSWI